MSEDWEEKKKKELERIKREEGTQTEIPIKAFPLKEGEEIVVSRKNKGTEEKNQDLKAKLTLLAEKRFREKKKKLGAPDSITTIEGLMEFEKNPRNFQGGERKGSSGTATWQNEQHSREGEGYESYEAMVRDLKAKAVLGVPAERREARKILDELLKKGTQGIAKTKTMTIKIPSDEQMKAGITLKDLLNEPLRQKKLFEKKLKDKRKAEEED